MICLWWAFLCSFFKCQRLSMCWMNNGLLLRSVLRIFRDKRSKNYFWGLLAELKQVYLQRLGLVPRFPNSSLQLGLNVAIESMGVGICGFFGRGLPLGVVKSNILTPTLDENRQRWNIFPLPRLLLVITCFSMGWSQPTAGWTSPSGSWQGSAWSSMLDQLRNRSVT